MSNNITLTLINSKLDKVLKTLSSMEKNRDNELMKVSDIAKEYGITVQTLYSCPWLLPNNGKRLKDGYKKVWRRKDVEDWLSKGLDKLEEDYIEEQKKNETKENN